MQNLPSPSSLPKYPQWLGLDLIQTRSQELHPGPLGVGRDPRA